MADEDAVKTDDLRLLYQVLTSRRLQFDSEMWQVPALGLTAQAFLLTIALDAASRFAARLISSLLACVIASMTLQLMAKHRYNEETDSLLIEQLENMEMLPLYKVFGVSPHARPNVRASVVNHHPNWLTRMGSYRLWQRGLMILAAADAAVFALAFTKVLSN